MKILFTEVQEWEQETLKSQFPDAILIDQKLDAVTASNYTDIEIISSFIYSSLAKDVLTLLSNVKLIATRSTGFDHIDIAYCKERGITVCNVPEYGSHTVAEHTFALILTLTRKINKSINQVKNLEFDHQNLTGIDLYEKTIGIIGYGKIGANVCKIAKGFGMNVQVFTRHPNDNLAKQEGFTNVDLETLLKTSDVITLHVPYSAETHHIINYDNIMLCKKGSYLINTARGGLIDTQALIDSLRQNIFSGVGLDVLEEENQMMEEAEILSIHSDKEHVNIKTLLMNHVLLYNPNVIITPHNAFNSREALMNILNTTMENIKSFENGKAINTILPTPAATTTETAA